jgi:SnoaL-like domain
MPTPTELIGEVADRLAIRGLVDEWSHCADRRKPREQAALFVADGTVVVYRGDPETTAPVQQLRGRAELAEAFAALETYEVTTHLNGQTVITLDGERATAESYCLASQVRAEDGPTTLTVKAIRYLDTFVRHEGQWLFAERRIVTDWADKRRIAQ